MTNSDRITVQPVMTVQEAAARFQDKYLTSAAFDTVICRNTLGTLANGEPKFLFLRNVTAPTDTLEKGYETLAALKFGNDVKATLRPALRGSQGKELVLGWLIDRQTGAPRLAVNTWRCTTYHSMLVPLVVQFGDLMRQYLPDVWAMQTLIARHNGKRLIGSELKPLIGLKLQRVLKNDRREPYVMTSAPEAPFSTITINKDSLCRSHTDHKNSAGMSCITTFGEFAGALLCFPRLRVAFDIQPGDVLIADTTREQHGNIGPLADHRISVVAYLVPMPSPTSGRFGRATGKEPPLKHMGQNGRGLSAA
jgi:hypothetical protein